MIIIKSNFSREILNCETADALVNQHEVLQTVGMVLIKYNAKWQIAKTHENILMNIIRLLHDYSRFKYTKSVLQVFFALLTLFWKSDNDDFS